MITTLSQFFLSVILLTFQMRSSTLSTRTSHSSFIHFDFEVIDVNSKNRIVFFFLTLDELQRQWTLSRVFKTINDKRMSQAIIIARFA
jgi:hypothetical protein